MLLLRVIMDCLGFYKTICQRTPPPPYMVYNPLI
jgi:hypothetical protein